MRTRYCRSADARMRMQNALLFVETVFELATKKSVVEMCPLWRGGPALVKEQQQEVYFNLSIVYKPCARN